MGVLSVFNLNTITTLQQTCLSSQPRVQYFRSLANIQDAFVTVFRRYLNNENGDVDAGAGVNAAKTAYFGAELKEVNYLPQIVTDIAPAHRTPPGTAALANNDLETSLQLSIGSKLIPTLPLKGGQQIAHLAMALGLEIGRAHV